MKWPWSRDKVMGMRPQLVILDETTEYSNLDRLDGLMRIPKEERGWKDSHYYEKKYGRTQ